MRRILSIFFWSIIAAAFIGPGTVTTAASSGSQFGYSLLWALLFSTIATLVLQEASARITVASGLSLGEAIRKQFRHSSKGFLVTSLIIGAIVFGCAAYQAGNILGAVSGVILSTSFSPRILTLILGLFAGIILWTGSIRTIAYLLSSVVAFMGVCFLITAIALKPPAIEILKGALIPSFPKNSGLLILGLIGTTVVPYNLFLGSGIASGQSVKEIRFGLTISILFGGLISMAVLVVGTAIEGTFSYESLASTLSQKLGNWGVPMLSFGLAGAGFSSAITAPLAAAVTAKSLFGRSRSDKWGEKGSHFRTVWLTVLLVGMTFGLTEIRPIPVIILAQVLNGMVLPVVVIFLFIVINDRSLVGETYLNGFFSDSIMSLVVVVTVFLGISNILKAFASVIGLAAPSEKLILTVSVLITIFLAWPIWKTIKSRRKRN